MYWVCLLLITRAISTAVDGISNVAFAPGRLLGRQGTSCDPECQSNEQCCADTCLPADLSCCPDDDWYCQDPADVCQPCPSGETCYGSNGAQEPWICCPTDGSVCTVIVSSGTGIATIESSSSSTPSLSSTALSSSSSDTSIATIGPSSTLSPSPTALSSSSSTFILSSSPSPTTLSSSPIPTTPLSSPSPTTPPSSPSPTIPSPSSSFTIVFITSSNTASFITSAISSSTYSPIPPWNEKGDLLVGYCATPEFSLVWGPQTTAVYFIGIVGCMGDKPDCCPYQVSSTTTTATATVTETVGPSITNQFIFPTATLSSLVTLPRCPEDYVTISSVCCPLGYLLWDELLGGITPCYSTLSSYLTPPPVVETSTVTASASPAIITSTVINVVYARNYPVNGAQTGLDTSAKVGIGVGVGIGALAGIALALWLWRWWKKRQEPSWYPTGGTSPQQSGSGSTP